MKEQVLYSNTRMNCTLTFVTIFYQSMEDSHLGHDTELVQERVVWGLNHEHDHAPTQDLLTVEKGVQEQPNHHGNAVFDIVQVYNSWILQFIWHLFVYVILKIVFELSLIHSIWKFQLIEFEIDFAFNDFL